MNSNRTTESDKQNDIEAAIKRTYHNKISSTPSSFTMLCGQKIL